MVWNIKCQEKRLVTITPSDSWGGAGLLGVTIRLDDYGGADERLIRVLDVEPSSPAAICGLVKEKDYLLGTTADSFDSTSTLAQVLQRHVDKVVEVYVYNTDSDVVRVVALMPTYAWGGQGLLGAEVGTGYLHRLPAASRTTTGSSVERKVRWVGMKPKHPAEQEQQKEATLEVEPQLEMEQEEGASHEETHKTVQQVAYHGDEATKRVSGSISESNGNAPPAQESAKQSEPPSEAEVLPKEEAIVPAAGVPSEPSEPPKAEEPSAPPLATQPGVNGDEKTTASGEQVPSQSQQEAESSAQSTQLMPPPPPPADAAALFAAPPPQANSSVPATSYAAQFMPPPPMSHLRNGQVDLR